MTQIDPFYLTGTGKTLEEQLKNLFLHYKPENLPVRLVFFGNASSSEEYLVHVSSITQFVQQHFGSQAPVFSYVAQPPVEENQLVMEVMEIKPGSDTTVVCKNSPDLVPYIVVETPGVKWLFVGGVMADSLNKSISEQSDAVFNILESIFQAEKMPVSSIVRQWNYIEKIVKTEDGHQNYQDFNNSRSQFYSKSTWENGYPAATGVGVFCGGVMIDLEAMIPKAGDVIIAALNNDLQVAAHAYSPCVLYGEENEVQPNKTTPKFERAKLVFHDQNALIYISGTAAIRGELSLENVGIEEQTRITLENIEHLISREALEATGIGPVNRAELSYIRIYLKNNNLHSGAKKVIDQKYSNLPAVYVQADVCRDELIVEIEGIATLR